MLRVWDGSRGLSIPEIVEYVKQTKRVVRLPVKSALEETEDRLRFQEANYRYDGFVEPRSEPRDAIAQEPQDEENIELALAPEDTEPLEPEESEAVADPSNELT